MPTRPPASLPAAVHGRSNVMDHHGGSPLRMLLLMLLCNSAVWLCLYFLYARLLWVCSLVALPLAALPSVRTGLARRCRRPSASLRWSCWLLPADLGGLMRWAFCSSSGRFCWKPVQVVQATHVLYCCAQLPLASMPCCSCLQSNLLGASFPACSCCLASSCAAACWRHPVPCSR